MIDAALIFAATYVSVFTLGLQSLNVNQGHYLAAAVTSFFISTGHIFLYRMMPEANALTLGGYYLGGILGITTSIWFHKRVRQWWAKVRHARAARAYRGICGLPPNVGQVPPKAPPPRRQDEHANVGLCGSRGSDTH